MPTTAQYMAEHAIVSVAGPTSLSLPLTPPGPLTIGRRATCAMCLPDDHVSRQHATLDYMPGERGAPRWFITDTESRHGTFVNGVRLEPNRRCPLRAGDLIIIAPWTFQVVVEAGSSSSEGASTMFVQTFDDRASRGATVKKVDLALERGPAQRRLALLLDCAAAIHAAPDEISLANAVLDAAVAGTGFANAAALRPTGAPGSVEVVAHRGNIVDRTGPRFSRSLIIEASLGEPALLVAAPEVTDDAYSVVQLGIEEALCVPLIVGQAVAGYLYLDNRRQGGAVGAVASDATEFAIGLGRLAAMSLANLMRQDLERRQTKMDAELQAAAEVQRWIFPAREGRLGRFSYMGRCKSGGVLGGDFFDVIALSDRRLAVALGDVVGKGVSASILMTAAQSYLHAALLEHGDPARALQQLNKFLYDRTSDARFVTIWLGVFDDERGALTYVDAGHGYAFLSDAAGAMTPLDASKAFPVAVAEEVDPKAITVELGAAASVLVVSDGIVEQPGLLNPDGQRDRFQPQRVEESMRSLKPGEDPIVALFAAVERYAGTSQLADDATAVLVRW